MAKTSGERESIQGVACEAAPDGMGGYDIAQLVLNVDSFGIVSVIVRDVPYTKLKEWQNDPEIDENTKANLWYLERLAKEFNYRANIVAEQLQRYIREL